MNISDSKYLFPLTFKSYKSFLFWGSCIACLYFTVKSSALLFNNYFNIYVFIQAVSYLAITVSLFFLSRASVVFSILNLCLSTYVFFQIYSSQGTLELTSAGINKQLFHLWLTIYVGYLFKKGVLK